jgi:hypothetical protein
VTTPERAEREGDSQPLPVPNDAPDIQSRVIADICARREIGIKRYGVALQPHNGRDSLLDLYEELLDACMYAKQLLVEREIENTPEVASCSDCGSALVLKISMDRVNAGIGGPRPYLTCPHEAEHGS